MRLKGYDYSSAGCYFITVCIRTQEFLFGNIIAGEMHLSENGNIAKNELLHIPRHYENVKIDKYTIMPNHIHAIITIVGAPLAAPAGEGTGRASASPTIGNIVRGYKAGVSRSIGFTPWQRSYHDHIIRDDTEYHRISQCIDQNPATWQQDQYYTE